MWLIQQWHDQPPIPQILASLWLRPLGVLLLVTVLPRIFFFLKKLSSWGSRGEEHFSPLCVACGPSGSGISGGNPWLQSMDGFKTEEWVCWAVRQWYWLSSFPLVHTAQVRVWEFGLALVFWDGMGGSWATVSDAHKILLVKTNVEWSWFDWSHSVLQVVACEKQLPAC